MRDPRAGPGARGHRDDGAADGTAGEDGVVTLTPAAPHRLDLIGARRARRARIAHARDYATRLRISLHYGDPEMAWACAVVMVEAREGARFWAREIAKLEAAE